MIGRIWTSIWLRLFLIAAVIFLLLIDLWGLRLAPGIVDYERFGNVGEWFSGIATVGVVIVAALAIRNDRSVAEEDRRRLDTIREDDARKDVLRDTERLRVVAQAVFVWPIETLDDVTQRRVGWKLGVTNATGAPVYNWRIEDPAGLSFASSKRVGPLFPGTGTVDLEAHAEIEAKLLIASDLVLTFDGLCGETYRRQGHAVEVINGASRL